MAKQMIVLTVRMRCERCKTKAFKIAAQTYGVTAVRLEEGEYLEKLVVEGQGVNIVGLVHSLEKKVGDTRILHVYPL